MERKVDANGDECKMGDGLHEEGFGVLKDVVYHVFEGTRRLNGLHFGLTQRVRLDELFYLRMVKIVSTLS